MTTPRVGIILLQLGGPDSQEAVEPFLRRLFSDPDIIPVPGGPRIQGALAWLIARARGPKVRGYYARIGGGSPLRRWTERQAELLQAALAGGGAAVPVAVAMRYAPPFTEDALDRLAGADRLLALTLFPQYSIATTGSSLSELARVRGLRHDQRPLIAIDRWFYAPDYWAALADRIRAAAAKLPPAAREQSLILWSAHGLPQKIVDRGDPYVREIDATIAGTMALLGDLGLPHRLCYQSRTGPIQWTRPATDEVIREEAAAGRKGMVVVPVSFVSDHIETLYEIDLLYGEEARRLGIEHFIRTDSFNDGADLTAVLARLVTERLAAEGWGIPGTRGDSMRHEARATVIGGGIAGLACAHALARRYGDPQAVVLLEGSTRTGGVIHSVAADGYRIEWAANGFLDNAPLTLELVRELGLESELEPSSAAARKRFLYRGGRLHPLPSSPLAFLRSSVLSPAGRLRVALEPFAPKAPPGDETIHDFAVRRIGDEAARILVDAMVSGIFAGDSRNLSLASCLPLLHRLEAEHGGLIRGMVAKMRAARRIRPAGGRASTRADAGPGGNLTSFRNGMESLPLALARSLARIELATPAAAIEASTGGYRVRTLTGETFESPALVVAAPPWAAAELLGPLDAELGREIAAIPAAPIAVVATGFAARDLPRPLDGFGFLVPRGQGLRILGSLWDSAIFRGRAPEGRVLLRTMIGGAHDPEIARLPPAAILAIVRQELATVLGIAAEPDFVRVICHSHGIPQYVPGHSQRLARIEARLARHPGLELAGFGYRGVAVNRVLEDASALAARIVRD